MWMLDDSVETNKNEKPTFLSVLGRKYDEDLISRVLVYIMNQDSYFVNALLQKYSNDTKYFDIDKCEINVYPEKSMGKGRADIFAVIKDGKKVIATITVENKIYSCEHDDQTQTYYDWVYSQQEYKNAEKNAFFYLRPAFNSSTAVCDKYQNITYADIKNMISKSDDIINDFKNHIEFYLGETSMELNEKQMKIINNYEKINELLNEATTIYASNKNKLLDEIVKKINQIDSEIKCDINGKSNPLGPVSVRLYKDKWWKENEYYFFSEIFFVDGKIDKPKFQNVVKKYPKKSNEKHLENFLDSGNVRIHSNVGQWSILEDVYSINDSSFPPNAWEERLKKDAVEYLTSLIKDADKIVDEFLEFSQQASCIDK